MKECIRCHEVKSSEHYTKQTPTKPQKTCKDCMNLQARQYRNKMTALVGRWKIRKGCQSPTCAGHPKHRAALHLAHITPAMKHHKHSAAIKPWWSKARVKEEIAKCRVLCANCHGIETYEEGHYNLGNKRDGLDYKNT